MTLLNKIKKKEAVIAIVGLGYVGLPLSFAFLKNGFRVIGLDNDKSKIKTLLSGKSYLEHINSEALPEYIKNQEFIMN